MSYTTYCTTCGKAYPMDDRSMEGRKVSCKKCGTRFVVSFDAAGPGKKAKKAKPGDMSSGVVMTITAVSVLAGIGMWAGLFVTFQDQILPQTTQESPPPAVSVESTEPSSESP